MSTPSKSNGYLELLTPENHALLMIDHQSQMAFGTKNIDVVALRNNLSIISKGAKLFNVPTILSTVNAEGFSGPLFEEIRNVFPDHEAIDRTTTNAWEDQRVVDAVKVTGKKKLVIAGLWTDVCVAFPVIHALKDGFEVYFITDGSGSITDQVHNDAVTRMVQAGATPITSIQYLFELYRDWGREEHYNEIIAISKEHGGVFGIGIDYAFTMFGAKEGAEQEVLTS